VRLWLIAVGVAFALVGGGLFASLFYLPNSPSVSSSRSVSLPVSPAGPQQWPFALSGESHGTVTLSWTSTGPANVSLYLATVCASGTSLCPVGAPLVSWSSNLSGRWSNSGTVYSYYLLWVGSKSSTSILLNGTLSEVYSPTTSEFGIPAWPLIAIGGILLLAVGVIALFLGMFLPGGVYAAPTSRFPPLPPRRPDLEVVPEEPDQAEYVFEPPVPPDR
jgi:hypothetical protein